MLGPLQLLLLTSKGPRSHHTECRPVMRLDVQHLLNGQVVKLPGHYSTPHFHALLCQENFMHPLKLILKVPSSLSPESPVHEYSVTRYSFPLDCHLGPALFLPLCMSPLLTNAALHHANPSSNGSCDKTETTCDLSILVCPSITIFLGK